jgi:hypothetical protein
MESTSPRDLLAALVAADASRASEAAAPAAASGAACVPAVLDGAGGTVDAPADNVASGATALTTRRTTTRTGATDEGARRRGRCIYRAVREGVI